MLSIMAMVSCGGGEAEENIMTRAEHDALVAKGASLAVDVVATTQEMANAITTLTAEEFPYSELKARYESIIEPYWGKYAEYKKRFAEIDNTPGETEFRTGINDVQVINPIFMKLQEYLNTIGPKYMDIISDSEKETRDLIYSGHLKVFNSMLE
jgi:hypothetical protein